MNISYRMATSNDTNALAEFWSENSGWDVIDSAEWKKRFLTSPFGEAVVSIATDDQTGNIIGQFLFIPSGISVNGKEMMTYRPFAPVLKQSLQTKFGIASLLTWQHPILKLYQKVADEMSRQGISFLYAMPDPRWARILLTRPSFMTHKFPLWSHPLPLDRNFILPDQCTVEKINPSDPAIDQLWQLSSAVYSSAIVRNSQTMAWKTLHGNYLTFAIRRSREITGMFTAIYKTKDYQWLICDLVTKDKEESLSISLAAACNMIQSENIRLSINQNHANKIALLCTPPMEKIVKNMGFVKEDYNFTLAIHLLNKNGINKKHVSPENWYVSAND